jgi:hypothetical protein
MVARSADRRMSTKLPSINGLGVRCVLPEGPKNPGRKVQNSERQVLSVQPTVEPQEFPFSLYWNSIRFEPCGDPPVIESVMAMEPI